MRNLFRVVRRGIRKALTRPGDAVLLVRMAWWVTVLSTAARLTSLPRALKLVAGNHRQSHSNSHVEPQEDLARAIDLLLSADVLVFKPICWKRAAVLHRYLLKRGIETKIIFGVRNDAQGKIDGHAWLELEGKPILEKSPPEYIVTYSFPSDLSMNRNLLPASHK
jgi:hypothetical protein